MPGLERSTRLRRGRPRRAIAHAVARGPRGSLSGSVASDPAPPWHIAAAQRPSMTGRAHHFNDGAIAGHWPPDALCASRRRPHCACSSRRPRMWEPSATLTDATGSVRFRTRRSFACAVTKRARTVETAPRRLRTAARRSKGVAIYRIAESSDRGTRPGAEDFRTVIAGTDQRKSLSRSTWSSKAQVLIRLAAVPAGQ